MEKLNVCLLNDSFPPAIDGVANAVTNYANIITHELGKATVVTPYYPNVDDSPYDFPIVRYPSIDVTKLVGYRAGWPFDAKLLDQLASPGFDIIHSHCPIASSMIARSLREEIDAPIVFTYHTKFDIDIANAVKNKLMRAEATNLLVENISSADEVWVVSHGAGENLKSLGYKGDYIVMPNGVDFPKGRVSKEEVSAACAGYDLPEGVPVFLFVGRMMWYKGLRITLDALKQLDEAGIDFRMVMIGGGGDKDDVVAYAAQLGLDKKVIFVDPIHDRNVIRAWYCRADLFLFPSTFDTNGLVVREAAACALGSVLVAGSCAAEDVEDGKSGLLIEENADSMAAVLKKVCGNFDLMKQIGQGAQDNLYMSWEASVKNAYARYEIVIDNYRHGLYPKHRTMTDEFFRQTAKALEFRAEMLSLRSELESRRDEHHEKMIENREKMIDRIDKLITNLDRPDRFL